MLDVIFNEDKTRATIIEIKPDITFDQGFLIAFFVGGGVVLFLITLILMLFGRVGVAIIFLLFSFLSFAISGNGHNKVDFKKKQKVSYQEFNILVYTDPLINTIIRIETC